MSWTIGETGFDSRKGRDTLFFKRTDGGLSIIVQRDATISSLFIYCKVTLHVSGVVAPIIRST